MRRGYEINNPLIPVTSPAANSAAKGATLPPSGSFVRLEPENLVLASIKKAEDSDAWVVQWYDAEGKETDAVLTLPAVPKSAVI